MANSAQARKRARQAEKHRRQHASKRSDMRTALKKVLKALESGDKEAAQSAYKEAMPVLDVVAGKGLTHKNKVARHKSRLNAHIKAM